MRIDTTDHFRSRVRSADRKPGGQPGRRAVGLCRRRTRITLSGAVIAALHEAGLSWRDIEAATGIPRTTAQRWAEPPERAPQE